MYEFFFFPSCYWWVNTYKVLQRSQRYLMNSIIFQFIKIILFNEKYAHWLLLKHEFFFFFLISREFYLVQSNTVIEYMWGFLGDAVVKNPPANVGDTRHMSLIPGLGRSLEKEMATSSSSLAWTIPMDRGAWWASIQRVTNSWTMTERVT